MALKKNTVVLVAIALLLGGAVLIMESQRGQGPTATETEGEAGPIFDFLETDVTGLHIETQTQEVTFERDDLGFWQMTAPEAAPAEEAAIAFLLSRLNTDGRLRTITVDASAQADFGLDVPLATVDITLADGTTHLFVLGDPDFSGSAYYALVDPASIPLPDDAGEVAALVVSEDLLNAVERPLEEWQVADPASTPTDGPTSTPGAAETESLTPEDLPIPDLLPAEE
ncbi:MAG: DUF4340 domain-containing protein [Cyanobacteria bacterium]|nr:DUF4340 domain-containing protein [Cyanobacteriota bacterium]